MESTEGIRVQGCGRGARVCTYPTSVRIRESRSDLLVFRILFHEVGIYGWRCGDVVGPSHTDVGYRRRISMSSEGLGGRRGARGTGEYTRCSF